jgi:hypothetical protein
MNLELGMRNEELGMPPAHPHCGQWGGGWEFLIPNSYFLIGWVDVRT